VVVFGFNGESYRGGEPTWDCCMDVKGKEEKMICRAMGLDPFKLFGVLSVNGKESLSISHAISETQLHIPPILCSFSLPIFPFNSVVYTSPFVSLFHCVHL